MGSISGFGTNDFPDNSFTDQQEESEDNQTQKSYYISLNDKGYINPRNSNESTNFGFGTNDFPDNLFPDHQEESEGNQVLKSYYISLNDKKNINPRNSNESNIISYNDLQSPEKENEKTTSATEKTIIIKKKVKKFKKKFIIFHKTLSENEINQIFQKFINKDMIEKFLLEIDDKHDEIKKIRNELYFQKGIRNKYRKKVNKKSININKTMDKTFLNQKGNIICGRKKKGDTTKRVKNQYSSDNLVKKIKSVINNSLIFSLNNIINALYNEDQIKQILTELNLVKKNTFKTITKVIKKIDQKFYAGKIKKDENLALLRKKIKEYLSNIISKKNGDFPPDYNEKVIEKLLEDKKNKDIFSFIFNLTLDNWIQIFTYKKDLQYFNKNNQLNEDKLKIIENNLIKIDNMILKINEFKKEYFHCFALIIYNIKEFFLKKEGRERKQDTIKKDKLNFNLLK
jgi:hypothetical protein